MSKSKRDWLIASLDLLLKQGIDGLTIASLTRALGVTKGSFYHHFANLADFKTQMLDLCLEESTTHIIDDLNQLATPYERLLGLEAAAPENSQLEVAVRVWALRDEAAQATLAEIDSRRTAYLIKLFESNGLPSTTATDAARLFYATYIGGVHLLPPLTPDQMQTNFAAIRQLYNIHPPQESVK